MTWQSRHDYVANAWWPNGSCHGYKIIYWNFLLICNSRLYRKRVNHLYSCNILIHYSKAGGRGGELWRFEPPWFSDLELVGLMIYGFMGIHLNQINVLHWCIHYWARSPPPKSWFAVSKITATCWNPYIWAINIITTKFCHALKMKPHLYFWTCVCIPAQ